MKFPLMILALCAALVLAIAGCGGSSDSSTGSKESTEPSATTGSTEASKESTESTTADKKTKPKVTVPKGISPKNFATKELEPGTGPRAKAGDEVTVQYVGVGYDSEEEFDSSWGKEPFPFTLGAGQVIKGWDQGVEGMKVGGRRELLIPANLAYGAEGRPPQIAPNEALIFVIDLLSIN
jgi:peptidylprolyl isomerase